jgi:parallel beta-helix repeat protein
MRSLRVARIISIYLVLILVISGLFGLFVPLGTVNVQAAGPTPKSGHITADETWTFLNSPYIIQGNTWVDPGVTLTIESGVFVKFDLGGFSLIVDGRLQVNGQLGNMTYFTSNSISTPFSGDWQSIELNGDNNVLNYCNITYATYGIFINNSDNNQVNNGWFKDNQYFGIYSVNSNYNEIVNSEFQNCWDGCILMNTSNNNNVTDCILQWSDYTGIVIEESHYNYFSNNFVKQNGNLGRGKPLAFSMVGMGFEASTFNLIEFSNITGNYGWGLYFIDGSSNNVIESCVLYNNFNDEIYLQNSQNVVLVNSTIIDTDIWNNHVELEAASHIYIVNSTYDKSKVLMVDPASKLTEQWFLNLKVQRFSPTVNIQGANVVVKDSVGTEILNTSTNVNGEYNYIICTDREQTGMMVNNTFTPHNVSAEKLGFFKGHLAPEPLMTTNRNLNLKLHKIPIDYVIIRDGPNGTGEEVLDRLYFKSNTSLFYIACYNNTMGYIGDLPSFWNSDYPAVATITHLVMPQSPAAILKAIENGTATITATHEGISDDTGFITVEAWNLAPSLTGIPDRELDEDQSLDNTIDLWVYSEDHETSDVNLTFSILNITNPDCGVSIDSNQYIDINPAGDWFGSSDVTIEVFDGYNKYDNDTFTITVNPVNDAPELNNAEVIPIFGSTLDLFNYTVDYLDIENNPAEFVKVAIDGINHTMVPGTPGDLVYSDGKGYYFITNLGAGTDHTYQFYGSDGDLETSTGVFSNPVVVAPDLYLSASDITISDDSPVKVNGTGITIQATIHNSDVAEVLNVAIRFEVKSRLSRAYADWTALGADIVIDHILPNSSQIVSMNWTAAPPGNYTIRVTIDPMSVVPESDTLNNFAVKDIDIGPDQGVLYDLEILPSTWTMIEGDSKQFAAKGYNFYGDEIPLTVTWEVNGGGTIDATGNFTAELWGTWEVLAKSNGLSSTAEVTVDQRPLNISELVVEPNKWIMIVNDTKQFTVRAYDPDGLEVTLNPKWELESHGGTIDPRTGLFTALETGKWIVNVRYPTLTGEIVGSAGVNILGSLEDNVSETFEDPDSNIEIEAMVSGSGTINISQIDDPDLLIPEELAALGIFVDITKSETLELICAMIIIPIEDLDLPDDVDLSLLHMFYWDDGVNDWILIEDSWVDGDFVYANVTHFTIFAPMAESTEKESAPEEEDNTMMYVLGAIILIIIIVIIIAIVIRRKRQPSEREEVEAEIEDEDTQDEDKIEIDLDELEHEYKDCPKCGEELEVPVSEDEKVSLKCEECGARGKMPNPYLDQIEELKKQKELERKKKIEKERKKKKAEKSKKKEKIDEMEDWDAGADDEDDELEWADDDVEEVDELDDWDESDDELEQEDQDALEDFDTKDEPEDEDMPDWDDEIDDDVEPDDEFEDWDNNGSDNLIVHHPDKSR